MSETLSVACRFNSCTWSGKPSKLLRHCTTRHRKYVRQINKEGNEFKFDFEDLLADTLLLVGLKGDLYWFLFHQQPTKEFFKRGVFAVGNSELCKFQSIVGQRGDLMMLRMGIFSVEPENSEEYQLKYLDRNTEFMVYEMDSKKFSLFFYIEEEIGIRERARQLL